MFNLNHLYYFYVVAGEGSVSSASRKLKLSQPALSVQIKTFEQSLGYLLFSRSTQGLQRTAAGDLVYRYATQIFGLTGELETLLRAQGSAGKSIVRVGVAGGIERPFCLKLIRLLFEGYPAARRPGIRLFAESHEALLDRFRARSLDAMLTDQAEDVLSVLGSYQMPVVAAVAATEENAPLRGPLHTLGSGTPAGLLAGAGWVLPSAELRLRRETDFFLARCAMAAPVLVECDLLASVVRAVLDGVGIGFLPLPYLQEAVRQQKVWISDPARPLWTHSLYLLAEPAVVESNELLTELQAAFSRWAREMDLTPPKAAAL